MQLNIVIPMQEWGKSKIYCAIQNAQQLSKEARSGPAPFNVLYFSTSIVMYSLHPAKFVWIARICRRCMQSKRRRQSKKRS